MRRGSSFERFEDLELTSVVYGRQTMQADSGRRFSLPSTPYADELRHCTLTAHSLRSARVPAARDTVCFESGRDDCPTRTTARKQPHGVWLNTD